MAQFGKYSSSDHLAGASNVLMKGMALHQRGKIADERTAIMKTEAETSEGRLELAKEKHTAELRRIPVPERQFATGEIANLRASGEVFKKKFGFNLNTFTPIANKIENWTEKAGYKKIDVHRGLKADWKNIMKPAQESIEKALVKAHQKGDMKAVEELTQLHTELSNKDFIDTMMPACARYEQDIQALKVKEEKKEKLYLTTSGYQEKEEAIGLGVPTKKEELRTGPIELGTAAKTKIEKGLIEATGGLARLAQIQAGFKPEYQQIGTRFSTAWTAGKEKLGFKPSEKDRALLAEFSEYKRDAINNVNLYIKEITGAQMSEPEAKRLMRGVPNPGKGIFDGDSPTQFKAKLDGTMKQLKVTSARFNFIRNNGLSISDVPLSQMPKIINNRAKQLETQLKTNNPNASTNQIRQMVKETIAQEFGLVE